MIWKLMTVTMAAPTDDSPAPASIDEALSDISFLFFEDPATYRHELLDAAKLDFSVDSLKHVDAYLEKIRKDRMVDSARSSLILRVGAYCGEVVRRQDQKTSWRWINHDGAATVEPEMFASFGKTIATAAVLFDGRKGFLFPLAKVEKYLDNGPEDSLHAFVRVVISRPW